MRNVQIKTRIKVLRNTRKGSPNDQWARIVDARTRKIIHTGQLKYIAKVAKDRYGVDIKLT